MIDKWEQVKLARLKRLPRRQAGVAHLHGLTICYNDARALAFSFQDIFGKQIYAFHSKNPAPVILDAGAYIGLATLFFKTIYPAARVTSFEPDAQVYRLLQENMRANGCRDVTLVNAGLGKVEGTAEFYPDGADGGSIYQSGRAVSPLPARLVRLSAWINAEIDLLKMNIEGAEGDVMEEIAGKLSLVRQVIIEYHAFSWLPQTLGRILSLLDECNFRYWVTEPPGLQLSYPVQFSERYRRFNLVYAVNQDWSGAV